MSQLTVITSLSPQFARVLAHACSLKERLSPQYESFLDMDPSCSRTCGVCCLRSSRLNVDALPVVDVWKAKLPNTSVASAATVKPVYAASESTPIVMPLPSRGRSPWLASALRAGQGDRTSVSVGACQGYVVSSRAALKGMRAAAVARHNDLNECMMNYVQRKFSDKLGMKE